MPVRDDLLKTVEAVHAAGLDENLWPKALAATAHLLGGHAATLEVFAPPSQVPMEFLSFGVPPAAELEYFDHYAPLSPRAAYAFRHPREEMLWDYKFIDEAAMDRDPFYAGLLPQGDCRYYVAVQFTGPTDTKQKVAVSIQRSPRSGHADKADIALLGVLLPHFRQAHDVAIRLRAAAAAERTLAQTLDWLADGAALVRADGTLLHVNDALQEIARQGDGIRIDRRRLEFTVPDCAARFAKALASARGMKDGGLAAENADFPVPRPAGAPPYLVSLRPLHGAHGGEAAAVVFIRDPLQPRRAPAATLREAFGLTAAEADLALALQAGMSLVAYARQQDLSLNTVYTHLRRIKDKTGCKRQSELVLKLGSMYSAARSE